MFKTAASLIGLLLLCQHSGAADTLPETEIYLLDISIDNAEPVNISQHKGYDNQPAFSTDGTQIFYSRFDDGQTDIWSYIIDGGLNIRLSRTPESEYSPRPAPHKNKLSLVRVEMDGSQRFSLLNLDTNEFKNLAEELSTVGYYSWFTAGSVALFLLPEPFELRLYASKDEQLAVATNIGRAMAKDPLSKNLLYVDKNTAPWQITAFNPGASEKIVVARLFPNHEDFAISASGIIWTALGGKLYNRKPNDKNWRLAIDLRAYDINDITRLAVSPDETRLALVNTTVVESE